MKQANWRACALAVLAVAPAWARAGDPLPSWNDGPSKKTILRFVADVTTQGGPNFVQPAERIATFDNDGTLWSEQPIYFQVAFALERVKVLAPQHPEWKTEEPFKTLLTGDVKGALAQGETAVLGIMAATHAGMTTEEFTKTVGEWATTAKHPRFGRLYTETPDAAVDGGGLREAIHGDRPSHRRRPGMGLRPSIARREAGQGAR